MKNESSIRPATLEDLRQIVEIERRVHVAPWTEEHFRAELGKPYSSVLLVTDDETDTQVMGYVVFWSLFDECQILNVAVDLPYRGLGHARFMIRRVISQAIRKGAKKVVLEVRRSNMPAIQLYQSLRFMITSVRKGFYSNGEDAYQMELLLQGEVLNDF